MGGNPLGQQVAYPRAYDPSLLVAIPREENRSALGINTDALPFTGADVWNAFEISWLNTMGQPQVARGRLVFPCTSPNLIESKSLKLYLNSLNLHHFAAADAVASTIEQDLSVVAGAPVQVVVQAFSGMQEVIDVPDGICLDQQELNCDVYDVDAALLQPAAGSQQFAEVVDEVLYSDVFRSLCPVTGQPDWATVVICYQGPRIDHGGLLKYLVSFREHRDFHENCVERIYCDIQQQCRPQGLSVEANFLRRGGLDINPVRSSGDSINYILLPRYNRQ